MKTKEVTLPKIEPYEADYQDKEVALNQVRNAKICFTLFVTMDGHYKILFSDFGEKEFIMLMILFDKNHQLREFIKSAIINSEAYSIDVEEDIAYSYSIEKLKADYQEMEITLNQIRNSQSCFTMFETTEGYYEFLFSDFGENEFTMFMILFHKNHQLREFFKRTIVNTELYRIDEEEAIKYSNTLLENIKMGK
jgi:hypothetical protein